MQRDGYDIPAQRAPKETTLREAVRERVLRVFQLHGVDAAMEEFRGMTLMFSNCPDWHQIDKEVMDFFLEQKRAEQKMESERKIQLDGALLAGLARGVNPAQLNVLTGPAAQAPYFQTTATLNDIDE